MSARPIVILASVSVAAAIAVPAAAADPVPLDRYGAGVEGAAAGQLSEPTGVAVDDEGNVYVAEFTNHRVSVFSRSGEFLRAFGKDVIPGNAGTGSEVCTASCKAGVASGQAGALNTPHGLAFDDADDLYVAERDNDRVSVFTPEGRFARAFGFDVDAAGGSGGLEVCTTSCQTAAFSTEGGALFGPVGLAFDDSGNLYVAEESADRISVFSPAPAFVRTFGKDVVEGNAEVGFEVCTTGCDAGTESSEPGAITGPSGLAFAPNGDLYVADSDNARISVFSPAPEFLRAFGGGVVLGDPTSVFEVCTDENCTSGDRLGYPGAVHEPTGVAFDRAGVLHAVEEIGDRISAFSTTPEFLRAYGKDVVPGNSELGFEVCTALCGEATPGAGAGELDDPFMATSDCRGAIYVSEFDNQRVQRFGEPGTAPPPCRSDDGDPSNEFEFVKVKRNKRKGTAKLIVRVPGPGELDVKRTKKVKRAGEDAAAEGKEKLQIRSRGKARKRLGAKGKARVRAKVTYTPTGGEPNTKSKRIVLRKRG
jgi:DNA-binding beta-propeller fold protein YncE